MKQIFAAVLSVGMVAPLSPLMVSEAAQARGAPAGQPAAALTEITIVTAKGRVPFRVEVARSDRERARGLMYRKSLPADGGMLFVDGSEEKVAMWMKNTFIPLDMLFIDARGRIVNIARNATPQSLEIIPSAAPVLAVLEIAGGTADRLGIQPGDKVLATFFSDK